MSQKAPIKAHQGRFRFWVTSHVVQLPSLAASPLTKHQAHEVSGWQASETQLMSRRTPRLLYVADRLSRILWHVNALSYELRNKKTIRRIKISPSLRFCRGGYRSSYRIYASKFPRHTSTTAFRTFPRSPSTAWLHHIQPLTVLYIHKLWQYLLPSGSLF